MSIKSLIVSILAVMTFSSLAMAQGGQPQQPQGGQRRGGGGEERMQRRGGFGQGGGMMMRRGGGGHGMMNFGMLNLTDAQKQRIQTLLETQRKSMEAARPQAEEMGNLMRLKMQGLLTTEQGTRLTALQAQMTANHDRMQNDILAVLTPDQKTLFEQMKNRRRGMGEGGGGMRMRMRRGGPDGPGGAPNKPKMPMGGGTNQPIP